MSSLRVVAVARTDTGSRHSQLMDILTVLALIALILLIVILVRRM